MAPYTLSQPVPQRCSLSSPSIIHRLTHRNPIETRGILDPERPGRQVLARGREGEGYKQLPAGDTTEKDEYAFYNEYSYSVFAE